MGHRASGVTRRRHQHREGRRARFQVPSDQARHEPGAHILERESRPVEQLEHTDAIGQLDQRHRKVERSNECVHRRIAELVLEQMPDQHLGDIRERRAPEPLPQLLSERIEALRHVESAIRRQTLEQGRAEIHRW